MCETQLYATHGQGTQNKDDFEPHHSQCRQTDTFLFLVAFALFDFFFNYPTYSTDFMFQPPS